MVRIKHRYLLVNILYPGPDSTSHDEAFTTTKDLPWSVRIRQPTSDKVNARVLVGMIRTGVEELFGDYGSGTIAGSLVVKYFSAATSTAIIRVGRAHYRLLWATLSFITKLPSGRPCVFQVVRVSGTIKKSEEEAIRRARSSIIRAQTGSGHSLAAGLQIDDVGTINMLDGIEDAEEDDED